MSKSQINPLLIVGGAAAVYLLMNSSSTASAAAAASNPVTAALANLIPGAATTTAAPAMIGINSGIRGGNGSFFTCSNYQALAAADPNLLNPKYQLNLAQANQYMSNYYDLQQWYALQLQSAANNTFKTIITAMQYHWTTYGCAEQRIFYPLQPPSTQNFIPAPVVPKSSGSGVLGTILKVSTIVAGGVITVATGGAAAPLVAAGESAALTAESAIKGTSDTVLNNQELQILFQGAAVLYEILPLYEKNDPVLVSAIKLQLDTLLKQYA